MEREDGAGADPVDVALKGDPNGRLAALMVTSEWHKWSAELR